MATASCRERAARVGSIAVVELNALADFIECSSTRMWVYLAASAAVGALLGHVI